MIVKLTDIAGQNIYFNPEDVFIVVKDDLLVIIVNSTSRYKVWRKNALKFIKWLNWKNDKISEDVYNNIPPFDEDYDDTDDGDYNDNEDDDMPLKRCAENAEDTIDCDWDQLKKNKKKK